MKRALATLATLAALAIVTGLVVLYGGFYNVGVAKPHLQIVYDVLEIGMRESVKNHSSDVVVPPLDDPALARDGLVLYERHCAQCHGAPGQPPEPFALALMPLPANLALTAREWKPAEIYWVVRNGIKMSGMPAWEFRLDDRDLWAVVAFVMRLPTFTVLEYEALLREFVPDSPRLATRSADAPARQQRSAQRDPEEAEALAAPRGPGPVDALTMAPAAAASRNPGVAIPDTERDPRATRLASAMLGDAERGKHAALQYGCTICHRIPGIPGPHVPVGPPLARMGTRGTIAGIMPNTPENMVRWLREPRRIDPRSAMPDLGIGEADARDIAAYMYTLD